MAFPYKLYGGALRPDAITGLDPAFSSALTNLYNLAPPNVQSELGLTSAYRSRAVQQQLWDRSDKTGHTVAAPGRSRHQFGMAADLWGFGLGNGPQVSPEVKQWVKQNAAAQGLYFPMHYEPWHIQLRGRAQGKAPQDVASSSAPVAMRPTALTSKQPVEDWRMGGVANVDAVTRGQEGHQDADEWLNGLTLQNFGMDDFTRAILTDADWSRALVYNTIRGLFT